MYNCRVSLRGITIKEAAEILSVSVGTLRNWDKKGKLKAKRAKNGYRYYSIANLEKFAVKEGIRRPKNSRVRLIKD